MKKLERTQFETEVQSPMTEMASKESFSTTQVASIQSSTEDDEPMRRPPLMPQVSAAPIEVDDDMLFDSIGIQFHVGVFCHQLLCHLFLPLFFTLPNPRAQGLRLNIGAIVANILTPLAVYMMVICYFCSSTNDIIILGGSVYIPIMYFVSHKVVVALKYATLSPTEYQRFNQTTDFTKSKSYADQIQLITGWSILDPQVLNFELCSASARIGAKINEIYLTISPSNCNDPLNLCQLRYWNAFVRGHNEIDWDAKLAPEFIQEKDGSVVISVFDVLLAVVRKAGIKDPLIFYALMTGSITTLFIILISFIPVMYSHNDIDSLPTTILFLISSTIVNYNCGRVFYFILYCAIVDLKRLLRIYRLLHCMMRLTDLTITSTFSVAGQKKVCEEEMVASQERIDSLLSIAKRVNSDSAESSTLTNRKQRRTSQHYLVKRPPVLGEKSAENHSFAMTPRVCFQYAENVTAWTYCRVTIQHFGDRFRNRFDCYVGGMCFLVVLLMIVSLLRVALSDDPLAVFRSSLFIQSVVTITILLVFLSILFVCGAQVNEELAIQKLTLAAHQMKVTQQLTALEHKQHHRIRIGTDDKDCKEEDELRAKEIEHYEDISMRIADSIELLAIQTELKPLKILGIEAQTALVVSIFTGSATFYSTLLSLYLNSVHGDVPVTSTA